MTPEWEWEPSKVAKFEKAQAEAREKYFTHLLVAGPHVLTPALMKDLPQAVAYCDAQVKTAQAKTDAEASRGTK